MKFHLLKQGKTWALIIPSIWALLTLYTTINAYNVRRETRDITQQTREINILREKISALSAQLGNSPSSAAPRYFTGLDSVRQCAEVAGIPDVRYKRVSRPTQTKKDNRILQTESYQINDVRLMQIIQFMDYAERNFNSLTCKSLTVKPLRTDKTKDNWEATIVFQYLVEK